MKKLSFLSLLCSALAFAGQDAAAGFYPRPGVDEVIQVSVDEEKTEVSFRVVDYHGAEVFSGVAPVVDGKAAFTVNLPDGFYDLSWDNQPDRRIGLYVTGGARDNENLGKDGYFCFDTAYSWTCVPNKGLRRELIEAMKNNGIGAGRERFNWEHVGQEQGKYDFANGGVMEYEKLRDLYREYNLPILEMPSVPHWNRSEGRNVPYNLMVFADDVRDLAARWQDIWCGWETWNEPDLNAQPDLYVPLAKVQAYESRHFPEIPLGGVISCVAYPVEFHDYLVKNDLLAYLSMVTYHSYGEGLLLEESVASFRDWLDKAGYPHKPLWITESNRPYQYAPKGQAYTREMTLSTMNVVATAVEGKACGLARFFAFIFADYHEPPYGFGMVNADGSPLPLSAGYFTATRFLSGFDYAGDIKGVEQWPEIKRARVFADAEGAAVVVWMTGSSDRTITVPMAWAGEIRDIDGKLLESGEGEAIQIPSGVAYYRTTLAELEGKINADTRAMRLFRMSQGEDQPRKFGSGVVMQPLVELEGVFNRNKIGYIYDATEMAETVEIPVNLVNLSDTGRQLACLYSYYDSATGEELGSGRIAGIEVPARQTPQIKIPLPLQALLREHRSIDLELKAMEADEEIDRAVVCLQRHEYETYSARRAPAAPTVVNFASQERWRNLGALWQWEEDLNCSFDVSWEPQALVIQVEAQDSMHCQPKTGGQIWMGDSFQFVMQTLSSDLRPVPDEKLEVGLAWTDANGPELVVYGSQSAVPLEVAKANIASRIERDGTRIRYEVTLQPGALGLKEFTSGMELGFSLILNDDDGFGRKGCMAWGDGLTLFFGMTKTYNRLKLTE